MSEQPVPESERAAMADLVVEVWDGKALRGTRNGEQRTEAILVRIQAILGQILASVRIPLDTNESKAAFELAKSLVLTGTLVVGDAAYCQQNTCQQIVDSGGDCLVTVKGNQPQLVRDIEVASRGPWPSTVDNCQRNADGVPHDGSFSKTPPCPTLQL